MRRVVQNIVMAAVVLVSATTFAQDSAWDWTVTPYVWLSALEGDVGVKGVKAPVDESVSDLLDMLEFNASVALDANNGEWGVASEVYYVSLEDDSTTAIGKVKGEVDQWILSSVPYFRAVDDDRMTLDVGAGARYMYLSLDVTTPANKKSGSKDWVDPLVMTRVKFPIKEKCYFSLSGDIGGFGVGSDLTWQLTAVAGHSFTEKVDLLIGYRHLDVDYYHSGVTYDMEASGAIVGVKIAL